MSNQLEKKTKDNEETAQLIQMLHEQMKANQEQLKVNEALMREVQLLREQIDYLTQKLYGRSKETLPEASSGQLSLDLFGEPLALPPVSQEEETEVRSHKRKKGTKAKKLAAFPAKEVHHVMTDEERTCEKCGTTMVDIGTTKVRDEIAFHQARIEKLQHLQHSYSCKNCERLGETSIKKATVPKPVLANSLCSPSLVAETIRLKFKQKVPAYRQIEHWQQLGLAISRDNITNWHIRVSQDFLAPLIERLHQLLLKQDIAYADETTYRVLESQNKTNYYWVFSTAATSDSPIAIYHHSESRRKEIPEQFFEGFKGYLHCDGYQGYNQLPEVMPVRCWAHARRKFFEAIPKKNKGKEHPAEQVLQLFKELFKKEQDWKEMKPEERLEKRATELRPLFDQLYAYLEKIPAVPKSKLDKAIQYSFTFREDLAHVFEDGRLEVTNNHSERLVKELVMGRKNCLFSNSLEGARTSGHILSVLKTAELNGLDGIRYLTYLFEELPNLPVLCSETLDDYLPWTKTVQETCK